MNYIERFIDNMQSIVLSFMGTIGSLGSFMPTSTSASSTYSSATGTANLVDKEFSNGTSSLATASTISLALVDSVMEDETIDTQITQAYVESMSVDELNEFIDGLENVYIPDKPKILEKTYRG